MNAKKCFTPIHCELHNQCKLAHMPYINGYFNPTNVSDHCHHFQQIDCDSFKQLDDDLVEKLQRMAGSHE